MSGAICNFIYGIPVTPKIWDAAREIEREQGSDNPRALLTDLGFVFEYTAYDGPPPGYLGFLLYRKWEGNTFSLEEPFVPEIDKVKVLRLLDALPPELRTICGPVKVWCVWSNS